MLDDLTELPEGWEVCTFGDIFDIKGGNQPPKSEFIDSPQSGYVRLLQIRDFESDKLAIYIKDDERLPKCSVDDLLIARYGASLGRICTGKSGSYNVALTKVIFDHDNLDRNWVKLFLESDWFQAPLFLVSRSAQNGFNKDELFPRSVPLPPLNEQKRIVAKIEELRSHTQAARNAIAHIPKLLEQFRQSVLAAAFRGDLTAEWRSENPDVEPAIVLLERIRSSRFDLATNSRDRSRLQKDWEELELIDSDDLPDDWLGCSIGHIGNVCNGSTPSRKQLEYWNGKIPWVSSGEVCNSVILETRESITEQGFQNSSGRLLPKGSVLIAMIGEGKTRGQSSILEIDATINQNIAAIVLDHKLLLPEYLWNWFQCQYSATRRLGSGSGPQALNCQRVREMPFVLSPLLEQQELLNQLDELLHSITTIEKQYQFIKTELDRLDRSILAKAFKGELVPQDPADEPAIVLLERIRNDRASQIKSIKIKRKKHSV